MAWIATSMYVRKSAISRIGWANFKHFLPPNRFTGRFAKL